MEKTGMKYEKYLYQGGKIIIYVWLLFSSLVSIISNKGINFEHLTTSIIFYSIFFIPIYFVLMSIPLNNKYKRRIIISLLSLVPVILSYAYMFNTLDFLIFSPLKSIFFLLIIFLLNFSLTIKNKPYYLIFITFINTLSSYIIYLLYIIQFSNLEKYTLIGIYNQDKFMLDSTIIMIILTTIMLVYIYHIRLLYQIKEGDFNA